MIGPTQSTVFDIHFPSDTAPGVPPYSARGLKGKLSLSDAVTGSDNLRRTINGTLLNLTPPQMRKYVLEISGDDQAPPALDGVWPGMEVVVDSNVELAFLSAGGSAGRTIVPGSERFEGDYTCYCMRLSMLVVEFEVERDEWAAEVGWSLTLEEV
jgi:hypothetical protein